MKKKLMVILLAAVMIFSFMPAAAFAADEKFYYVSIGDSTTNGFGFEEYYLDGKDVRGFNRVVPQAYPALIKAKLEETYGSGNVVLHQFAGSALRPDDLDAILDPNHVDDDYTSRVFTGHNRGRNNDGEQWFKTWGQLIDPAVTDCAEGEIALRNAFYSAINEADLITYYLGSNNFGTFITGALTDNRYGDTDNLQDLLTNLGISQEEVNVAEIRGKIMGFFAEQLKGKVDLAALDAQFGSYIDLFVQGYVGDIVYYTKNIKVIRQLNPDCDLVVVGLHNYVNFVKADFNGQSIDFGYIYGKILEMANIYMGSLCPGSDDYYYADLAETEFPVFVEELFGENPQPDETMQGYLDEMVGGIAKGIVPALAQTPTSMSDKAIGAMLRSWYEKGFSESDYDLIALLAKSMDLLDEDVVELLDSFGLTPENGLKFIDLYHTESDDFIPMLDGVLGTLSPAQPNLNTFRKLLKVNDNYINFSTLKLELAIFSLLDYDLTQYLNTLDEYGAQLDAIKNYGRVQEILLDCVNAEPFDLNAILSALNGGLNMDAIGTEVAAVLMGQQQELSPSTKTLINLYFMFMFPNGMGIGAHPNAEGHEVMADVIYGAYENKVVAKEYMDTKVLTVAEKLIDQLIAGKGDVTVPSFSEISLKGVPVSVYTSLGDSTVFGFGLEDFATDSQIFTETYGYNACSKYAYPAKLAELFDIDDADFHQLAMGSIRVEDILYIMSGATTGDDFYQETIIPLLNEYAGGVDKAQKDYISNIKSSDLVSVAMGGNNFGSVLNNQIDRMSAGLPPMSFDWSKYSDSEMIAIKAATDEIFTMLKKLNPDARISMLQVLAESFIYEYVNVMETFALVPDKIHELNPDAKIVLMGLFNPVDDVYYQKNGTTSKLKLGKILDILMANLNTSFRAYAEAHSDYCCFVNVEDTEMFIDSNPSADWNLGGGMYLPYVMSNHGLPNHPTADGHDYMYKQIKDSLHLDYCDNHNFGAWTPATGGQHSRTCSACGFVSYEECTYGADHKCVVCGQTDPDLEYVTATFVTGEKASVAPAAQKVIKGEGKITKPADPTKLGYLFEGWYATGAETVFDFNVPLTANVKLTAKWAQCTDHNYADGYCTKCGAQEPPFAIPFVDVEEGIYYYDAVKWAYQHKITDGTSETTFSPDTDVTRGQVVTFLWRVADCPTVDYKMSFTDVESDMWYTEAIRWALSAGITKGTSETTFSPNEKCSRAQIVTFLARFSGVEDTDTENVFTDVKASDYFAAAVKWAKDNGITLGTTATTFDPNKSCTRGQTVTFLYRLSEK